MENNKSKLDHVLEGYRPIPSKKVYYPRNLNLSEDFINSFHREYDRLVDEGINPKSLVERFGKALRFHVSEERRYKKTDETEKLDEGQDCPPGHTWNDKAGKCVKKSKDEHDADMRAANAQTASMAGYNPIDESKKKKSRKKGGTYGMGDSHAGDDD